MITSRKFTFWMALVLTISFLNYSCNIPETQGSKNAPVKEQVEGQVFNVSAKQFQELINRGDGIILDVRTKGETDQGHIADASFQDLNNANFQNNIELMAKDKPMYVYCASGARSYKAAQIMVSIGFKTVYNLNGGMRVWQNAGLPVTKSVVKEEVQTPEISLEDFNKMLDTDQAVLVEFQTKWCSPCKKMAPVMNDLKQEFKNKAVVVQIDADQNKNLAKHLQLNGIPEFIVFKNKKETWRHSGVIEAGSLREILTATM